MIITFSIKAAKLSCLLPRVLQPLNSPFMKLAFGNTAFVNSSIFGCFYTKTKCDLEYSGNRLDWLSTLAPGRSHN